MHLVDLTGKRFGTLVVTKRAPNRKYGRQSHVAWECICDCGKIHTVTGANLFRSTRSCGCSRNESIRKSNQKERGYNGLTIVFNDYRSSSRRRGLEFKLSREEIGDLVSRNCSYCNSPPRVKLYKRHRSNVAAEHANFPHNGLDRLDSDLGYTLSNVVTCCDICNYAKRELSESEFLAWVEKVYNNRILKR